MWLSRIPIARKRFIDAFASPIPYPMLLFAIFVGNEGEVKSESESEKYWQFFTLLNWEIYTMNKPSWNSKRA